MRHSAHEPPAVSAGNHCGLANGELLDWDDRASLAELLAELAAASRGRVMRHDSPWQVTMPVELVAAAPSRPFEEPLRGLAVREVLEPDVFRHFFGRPTLPVRSR